MGRPVKKDKNGTVVFGDYTTTSVGIKCEAYIGGSNQTDVFIVQQRGSRRYLVQDKSAGTKVIATLVVGTPAAVGEMRMTAFTAGGPDASATYIRKLTKKIAIDFSGNRYSWFVDNDSSGDQLIIAPF